MAESLAAITRMGKVSLIEVGQFIRDYVGLMNHLFIRRRLGLVREMNRGPIGELVQSNGQRPARRAANGAHFHLVACEPLSWALPRPSELVYDSHTRSLAAASRKGQAKTLPAGIFSQARRHHHSKRRKLRNICRQLFCAPDDGVRRLAIGVGIGRRVIGGVEAAARVNASPNQIGRRRMGSLSEQIAASRSRQAASSRVCRMKTQRVCESATAKPRL